jgi:hypothetical protein
MRHGDGNGYFWEAPRHAHDAWWHGPLTFIVIVLVIGLLVAGVVWLVRRWSLGASSTTVAVGGGAAALPGAPPGDPAVAALRLRYAQGEVAREDYLSGMADLTGARPAEPSASTQSGGAEASSDPAGG